MTIELAEDEFGEAEDPITKKKQTIRRFTFTNELGIEAQIITLGATITSIKIPDECGTRSDIVLGFDDVEGYQSSANPYFGCTVGRVCNRIAKGKFNLDGQVIQLSKNFKNTHHLHGGFIGLNKVIWDAKIEDNMVIMSHVSADGHEGYPGEIHFEAKFQFCELNSLCITYNACSSAMTPINLTNHAYFNLAGHDGGSTELQDHILKITADRITETDNDSIPTGKFISVDGTPYDFRKMTPLSERFSELRKTGALGYDDNYCINLNTNKKLLLVAKVAHAKSGRWLEVLSNQPGLQFYTANYFPNVVQEPIRGKDGAEYYKHGGFCLESQKFPDAVNHPNFQSVIIGPEEVYSHKLIYKFGICIGEHQMCQIRKQTEEKDKHGKKCSTCED